MQMRISLGAVLAVVFSALGGSQAHAFVVIGPTQVPNPVLTQDINVPSPTLTFNQAAPRGIRLRSPIEGVITSWRTYSGLMNADAGLQLRVLTDEGAGSYRVRRSGPIEFPGTPANSKATEQTFSSRIPIEAGAMIGVQRTRLGGGNLITIVHDQPAPSAWLQGWFTGGAPSPPADGGVGTPQSIDGTDPGSDPFFPISAIVEPDADHDLFGDETQDRCPSAAGSNSGCPSDAFEVPAPPAQGAALLGPNLEPAPADVVTSNRMSPSIVSNTKPAPGVQLRARFRGVVTRWSFYTGNVSDGSSAQLRVLRRIGEDEFQAVASGPVEALTPGTGPATQRTFPARVPVATGDEIGVGLARAAAGTLELTAVKTDTSPSPWDWGQFAGSGTNFRFLNDGDSGYPTSQIFGPQAGTFLPISAVVERDADGDLFGDNTQDRCLNSAGPVDGCPEPPPKPPEPPPPPEPPTPQVITVVPASANAIVDPNSVRFTAGRKKLRASVSCPQQLAPACAARLIGRTASKFKRARGKRKFLSLGAKGFKIGQGTTKPVVLKVPAATRVALKRVKRVKLVLTVRVTSRVGSTARSRTP
jgi:hypothetical protein